jgi:hypothetical protein
MPRSKAEILQLLVEDTHALWAPKFIAEVNEAFGTSIQCMNYAVDGDRNPRGLSLYDGVSESFGLASFHIAPELCHAFDVPYESRMGRGSQVRECVAALIRAGRG